MITWQPLLEGGGWSGKGEPTALKDFGTPGNYLACTPRVWYLHHRKTWLTYSQREPHQGIEFSQRLEEGGGVEQGLPWTLGGGAFLSSPPTPKLQTTQLCHLLGNQHCAGP